MYCNKCGTELKLGETKCPNCGKEFGKERTLSTKNLVILSVILPLIMAIVLISFCASISISQKTATKWFESAVKNVTSATKLTTTITTQGVKSKIASTRYLTSSSAESLETVTTVTTYAFDENKGIYYKEELVGTSDGQYQITYTRYDLLNDTYGVATGVIKDNNSIKVEMKKVSSSSLSTHRTNAARIKEAAKGGIATVSNTASSGVLYQGKVKIYGQNTYELFAGKLTKMYTDKSTTEFKYSLKESKRATIE